MSMYVVVRCIDSFTLSVYVQETRIYSMISDGLQMSVSSAIDKNTQSGVDTLLAGECFVIYFSRKFFFVFICITMVLFIADGFISQSV